MDFAALQHSLFLHALGSAILNSLWQCFILWLVYETISVSYKSASARFKNNLSTLLLFLAFGWFLASFVYKILYRPDVISISTLSKDFVLKAQPGIHAVSGFSTFLSYASASLPYLSVAYIFLLVFLISRLFAAYRYVYFISNRRLVHPTEELQFFALKVASEIGIAKKIRVWISHHIDVPATIGFIKPVILIPLASINNLSASQLEAIILHELAHIKRNDYITNLIISVIETILFFNPFVVLLSGIIKRERENCCDDFVLQYRYDPHSYASALLRLEQSRMSKLKLAIGAVSGKKQLLSRIKRITNSQVASRQFNYGQKLIALLLVTAIICSVAWLTPEEKKSVQTKALTKETKPALVSKTKLAGKVQQPAQVIPADKAIENLLLTPLKHLSPKNDPVALAEADVENLPTNSDDASDNLDENKDENKNTGDFFKVEDHPEYSEVLQNIHKLNQPHFSFDEKGLKFPPFINVHNFPLQNMNFNIDLSKIDVGKLNENLKLAYKQINALDWNKVQNEIQKSFSRMKLSNLSKKGENELFYRDKVRALVKLNTAIGAQQQYDSKAVLDQLKKALLMDSLQTAAQMALCDDEINTKVRGAYKKMQMQYERRIEKNNYSKDSYYYNYSNSNTTPATPGANANEDEATECSPKGSAEPNSRRKMVRISIKRTSSHTGVLNEKMPFQFSVDNDDEKSNRDNVITVEITN